MLKLTDGPRICRPDGGKDRRDQEGHGGQRHHADLGPRADGGEGLYRVTQPAGQEGRAQHQQQVADDRAGDRGLDHVEHAGAQRHNGDDQLRGVTQRGIEQAADRLANPGRELLRGKAEQASQRDDGDAGDHEAEQRGLGAAVVHPDGRRNSNEQPGQWRLGQHASQCLHRGLPR